MSSTTTPALKVTHVTMFKHGVAFFTLQGEVSGGGTSTLALEFKKDEMNDVLKSLLAMDTSGKGFISSISYDAEQDIGKILENVAIDLASKGSFTSLLENFRGADVTLTLGGDGTVSGKIMGVQEYETLYEEGSVKHPALVVLGDSRAVVQVNFPDIKAFALRDPKLQKDLEFYLNTIIAGKKKDSKRIFIHCEAEARAGTSEAREIVASYLIESPVWKTSYRLIIPENADKKDTAFLNGWCLVENTTTQDWEDINLTLVAGMPVSFVCPIYPPIFMDRPVVEPPRVAQIGPAQIEDEMDDLVFAALDESPKAKQSKRKEDMLARAPPRPSAAKALAGFGGGPPGAPPPGPPGGPPSPPMGQAMAQAAREQTKVSTKDMGELFEYEIAKPVTIKRKQSALVPIVAEDVEGKRVLLYEESQHPKNPMACLEVTNTTGVTLEGGPVTIFFEDSLAGEAMLPFLNQDEERILSYALEQGCVVEKEVKDRSLKVHRVAFSGGYAYEYYYRTRKTTYKVNNKTERDHLLYLDHPKAPQTELVNPPLEPKDTPNFHRFPIKLGAKKAIKFEVNERRETYSTFHIWDMDRKNLLEKVQNYIENKWILPAMEGKLKEVGNLLESHQAIWHEKEKLESELNAINNEQYRLRENLKSIGTSRSEVELREKYVTKLDQQETRLEEIVEKIKECITQADKVSTQIQNLLNELEEEK